MHVTVRPLQLFRRFFSIAIAAPARAFPLEPPLLDRSKDRKIRRNRFRLGGSDVCRAVVGSPVPARPAATDTRYEP